MQNIQHQNVNYRAGINQVAWGGEYLLKCESRFAYCNNSTKAGSKDPSLSIAKIQEKSWKEKVFSFVPFALIFMLAHKLSSGGFPVKSNRRLRVATIPLKMAAKECQPPNLQTFAKPQPDSLLRGKSATQHQAQVTVFGSYPSQRRPSCLPNSFSVETCKMQNVLI